MSTQLEKIILWILTGIIFSLPFSIPRIQITSFLTILLIAAWLLYILKTRDITLLKKNALFIFIFSIPYLIYVAGTAKSVNYTEMNFILEKKISILIFPIVIGSLPFLKKKDIEKLVLVFIYSCLGATAFAILTALYEFSIDLKINHFVYHELSNNIYIHGNYLAMYLGFSICLLHFLFSQKKITKTFFYGLSSFFLMSILLLSARMQIITITLLFLFEIIRTTVLLKKIKQAVLLLSTFSALLFSFLYFIPANRDRVKEAINYRSQYELSRHWGGRALRMVKWNCSMEIWKTNFLTGIGTGNSKDALNDCYRKKNQVPLLFWKNVNYNSHNQFLQTALDTGIVGLILYLVSLTVPILISIRIPNTTYLLFSIIFIFSSITESILETNKGILFYSIFNSILFFNNINPRKTE